MQSLSCASLAFVLLLTTPLQNPPPPREALEGFDPVLLVGGQELPGKDQLTAVHGGFQYFFATEETRILRRLAGGRRRPDLLHEPGRRYLRAARRPHVRDRRAGHTRRARDGDAGHVGRHAAVQNRSQRDRDRAHA